MISMQGVPSALILRNESWVRQQAAQLVRRVPANVEKADLIQVGLIAVAQAALGFEWEGDRDSEAAREAFVRYARQRVHGAMLDELRQMDNLSRDQRRKVKLVQVARERWRASHAEASTAADISPLCGLSVDEIYRLEADAQASQAAHAAEPDAEEGTPRHEAATPQDEVEARVDTALLMRRLESFFAQLPPRERQVIDAYLGVGLSPVALAEEWQLSPTRVSQMFRSLCDRIGVHLGHTPQRSTDRAHIEGRAAFDKLVRQRETELADPRAGAAWSETLERLFTPGIESAEASSTLHADDAPLRVDANTRWG
jgi:RNA polymerase sigma factor for flagellar operon FliA